ncbi:hypothetical protein BH11PSE7_BH11PSE7_22920 [soil metagenome]
MSSSISSLSLRKSVNMKRHLHELGSFVGRSVTADELEDVAATNKIKEGQLGFSVFELVRFEIPFSQKTDKRFKEFIERLTAANPASIYLWTAHATDCGALKLGSLSSVNFDFSFDASEQSLFSLLTTDFADRMLLEFHEESGRQILVIEVQGKHWSSIRF